MFYVVVVEKGTLSFTESVFHHLVTIVFYLTGDVLWVFLKDRKSFTVETVSSTPTMSRSSSISGVDMAGLQTSFLSQVSSIDYIRLFFDRLLSFLIRKFY